MAKKFMEACIGIFFLVLSIISIFGIVTFKAALDKRVDIAKKQLAQQQAVINSANETKELLSEAGYAFFARVFEDEGVISPTDADRIVLEAITKLKKHSEKLGMFAEAINNSYKKNKTQNLNQ